MSNRGETEYKPGEVVLDREGLIIVRSENPAKNEFFAIIDANGIPTAVEIRPMWGSCIVGRVTDLRPDSFEVEKLKPGHEGEVTCRTSDAGRQISAPRLMDRSHRST